LVESLATTDYAYALTSNDTLIGMVDPEKGVDRNGDSILIQMRPN
jgi:hypothetical protein